MSDNSNKSGLGAAAVRMLHAWTTEVQVRPFEGFAPGEVVPRSDVSITTDGGRHMQLARPYPWTWRDDLNCLGNYDAIDTGNRDEAAALCAGCPVLSECLESAMEEEVDKDGRALSHHSRFLVRGGLTPRGRVDLAAKRVIESEDTVA